MAILSTSEQERFRYEIEQTVSTENVINNGLVYVWLNISNMIQMLI